MDFQRFQNMAWKDLYSRSVHELMDSKSFSLRDVDVSFEAVNTEAFLRTPIGGNGTNKQTLNIKIKISHESGYEEINRELIELPVLSSEGFLIENVKYALISTFQLASGWYIKSDPEHGPKLTLQRGPLELISVTRSDKGMIATVGAANQKIPLFDFIRAVAGAPTLTEEDILEELHDCKHIVDAYYTWRNSSKEIARPLNDVSAQVYAAMSGRLRDAEYGDAIMLLQEYLHGNKMRMGTERVPRFKKFTSFTRAIGCTLAEPVQIGGSIFDGGEVLTSYALRKMDSVAALKQIVVIKDDVYYTLKKQDIDSGLTYDELCCALRVYDQLLSGIGKCDDPDEQYNRILYTVRDAFEGYIEEALNAVSNALMNCIMKADVRLGIDYICSNASLPGCVPFNVTADKIKSGNSAFQQLDETNSLSDFEQGFRITSGAKHVTKSARDIHASEFGRVCPYTTSESKQVGLNRTLSVLCGVDSFGFLTTPVHAFSNGRLSKEVVNISALDELAYVIAPADINLEELWAGNSDNPGYIVADCRVAGQIGTARLADVTHQEVSGVQSIGPLVATVPSANRNSGKRLVMTVSAQRQALPTWKRERPFVTTGIDAICEIGVTTAGSFISKYLDSRGITVESVPEDIRLYLGSVRDIEDSIEVTMLFTYNGRDYMPTHTLNGARSTVNGSLKYERLAVPVHSDERGQYFLSKDVLFYQNDIDTAEATFNKDTVHMDTLEIPAGRAAGHSPALGANVSVMFKSMDGYSYEDSIVVNEDFLLRYGLAVVKTKKVSFTLPKKATVGRGGKMDWDTPQLDPIGYPIKGFYVQTGQEILSVKTVSEDGTEKIGARYLGVGENGFVLSHKTYVKNGETIVDIHLGDILPLDVGDKIEGLHGNKGVIGRIVPAQEMPFTEDGEVPDMIFNPLGVLARLNMGQMIEFTKGAIAEETGEIQIMEPFSKESIQDIATHASELGLVEKKIYDGRTGLPYSRKAMIGNMYILRLMHTSTSKYNATGNCASNISKRTLQPMRCQGGGQRVSELCSWCLVSYNATETLNSLFTIQSDSLADKRNLDKAVQQRNPTNISYESNNIDYLKAYFYMLGANISVALDGCTRMELLTDKFMQEVANGHNCHIEELSNNASTAKSILHDPRVFPLSKDELKNRKQFGFLPFNCEMIMPLYLNDRSVPNLFACIQFDAKKHEIGYTDKDVVLMSKQMFDALISSSSVVVDWAEVSVNSSHSERMRGNYGVSLPDTFTVPVIQNVERGKDVSREAGGEGAVKGIRAVISLFKTYDTIATLCAPAVLKDADKVANILLFNRSYKLSDFIVKGMLIPPVGYRPISEDDKESSNPIDTILAEIIKCVKSLLPKNLSEDQRCNKETNLYLTLKTNLIVHDNKNTSTPSIAQQLSDHQSGVSVMRDTLLAKRVAYSGRSVISIAPDLELGECGVPIPMLATMFEDHIAAEITSNDSEANYILKHVGILNNDKSAKFVKRAVRYLAVNNLRGFKVCCISHISTTPDEFFRKISSECLQGRPPITTVYQLFEKCFTQLKEILEKLLEIHPILLNREPSLHKFSIQGFRAKPVESYAIQLHPASCRGFNADYDGDQMAVIAPMTNNSRREVYNKMLSSKNLIDPKDGSCIVAFNQDIILGLYYATIHKDNVLQYCPREIAGFYKLPDFKGFAGVQGKSAGVAQEIYDDIVTGLLDVHDTIICTYSGRRYIGEAGRFVINALLPNGMGFTTSIMDGEQICGEYANAKFYSLFIGSNFVLTKKTIKTVEDTVIAYFVANNLEEDEVHDNLGSALNRFLYFGFKFADLSGITLSLHDFVKLPIKALAEEEMQRARGKSGDIDDWFNLGCCDEPQRDSAHIDTWSSVSSALKKKITRGMKGDEMFDRMSNIFLIVDSGARGDVAQLLTMSGLIGIVTNSSGRGIPSPIQTSYIEGLNAASFFQNAPTARRQVVSAQLTTADSGTLTRSYIYLNEHQRIRDTDERCDAESLWIDVDYEVQIREDRSELTLVTDAAELNSIDFDQFSELDVIWGTEPEKQHYIQCLEIAIKISNSTALTDEFLAQMPKLKMTYLICRNSAGEYVYIAPEIKMSPTSRSQLLYRVFDASADSTLTSTIARTAFDFLGEEPDELGDDFVIGEDTISRIEMNMIQRVPIFSIIGCKSVKGICRCCYGLKYDTFAFPDFGECIGYQSVQAIGNPITQLILDSHKVEFTGGPSAASRLTEILKSRFKAVEIDSDSMFSVPFATKDNLTVRFGTNGSQRIIALQSGDEIVQEIPFNNVLDVRVVEGQTVDTGYRVLNFKTNLEQWASLVAFTEVQKYIWGELCSCFDSEFIYARHFELFARSITEFGVAESTELSKGIIKGEIYLTTKLDMAGIRYEPISVGIDKAITYADKVVAGIAQEHLLSRLSRSVVVGATDNPASNVGKFLIGNLTTARNPVYAKSVLGQFEPEAESDIAPWTAEGEKQPAEPTIGVDYGHIAVESAVGMFDFGDDEFEETDAVADDSVELVAENAETTDVFS